MPYVNINLTIAFEHTVFSFHNYLSSTIYVLTYHLEHLHSSYTNSVNFFFTDKSHIRIELKMRCRSAIIRFKKPFHDDLVQEI